MFGLDAETSLVTWVIVVLVYGIDLLVRLWLLFYIPKMRKPTSALAWLLLIFIVPIVGTIFFFIIGSPKLSRKRRAVQEDVTHAFKQQTDYLRQAGMTATTPAHFATTSHLATSLTSLAPTKNNQATLIHGYDNIIEDITAAADRAQHHVLIEFYILALDSTTEPLFEALERAVARGVSVYVLFDAWGSRKYPRFKEMQQRLDSIGAHWRSMLPLSFHPSRYNRPDLRNHRKIVVIDTKDAYLGSINMIDKHYHRKDDISYLELVIHLQGPAVTQASAVFSSDWYAETGEPPEYTLDEASSSPEGLSTVQIIPSGPSYQYQNNLKFFVSLIHNAKRSIVINNPYLVPDESLLHALISAVKRGVEVSILNSEVIDQWAVGHAQRSYYEELLAAGLKISLYKKPQLVHEKCIAVDDRVAVIGSSNFDIRSFELSLECIVAVYDQKVAQELRVHHENLLANSQTITLEQWRRRPVFSSAIESITRLSSSLQ